MKSRSAVVYVLLSVAVVALAAAPNVVKPPKASAAAQYAVTPKLFDDIGAVLTDMGYAWDEIPVTDLANYTKLKNYKAVFINCSVEIQIYIDNFANAYAVRQALVRYVREGGSIYASDFAYLVIDRIFPGKIYFDDNPQIGDSQAVIADITNPGLANYIDANSAVVEFDLDIWAVIAGVAQGTTVYMRGDCIVTSDDSTRIIDNCPICASFSYGAGSVFYTSFHNHAQASPIEKKLLEYFIGISAMGSQTSALKGGFDQAGYGDQAFYVNFVNPGQTMNALQFKVVNPQDLMFGINWAGSTLNMTVKKPNGEVYKEVQSDNPPGYVEVKSAEAGDWSVQVSGVNVPYNKYPFAVGVATKGVPPEAFYFAEGTCRPNFDPYICIQNPSDLTASVRITFMLGDSNTKTKDMEVAPASRSTLAVREVLGTGEDNAHDFSAKVETTNSVGIIAERPMYFNYAGKWTGGHDVVGANGAATTWYFAEGTCRPNFDPFICIQNPGTTDAQVSINYMLGNGQTDSQEITVPKQSRYTVVVKDKLGVADDEAHDFSAVVNSANEVGIIVERPMYFNYGGVWTGGHDVVGALSAAPEWYFAEGTCRPNFDPYICIQNPNTIDAAVKITYMLGNGQTAEESVAVPGNSRSTVVVRNKLGTADDDAHDFSAKVESITGLGIIAERPMYFNYAGKWTGGHDVVGTLIPGSSFYFAEGTCRPNFDPYICIQNPGSTDANVHITYMLGNGSTAEDNVTVPQNSRRTVIVREKLGTGDDAAHDFSAKVECTNGQQIIAERPMYFNYKGVWTGGHDVVGYMP